MEGQMEDLMACDNNSVNSIPEDPANSFTKLMNFENSAEWCNSLIISDQMFASLGLPLAPPLPYTSFDALNILDQTSSLISDGGGASNDRGSACTFGDEIVLPQTMVETCYPDDTVDANDLVHKSIDNSYSETVTDISDLSICKSIPPTICTLDERMLRALSILKESSGGGILAQVWVPIKYGDQYKLSTSNQPYLLDQMLSGYREVSRTYTFPPEVKSGSFPGLPGRVYVSKVPEWTSDITYYKEAEYLRAAHAIKHDVHGSIAIPIFESHKMPCCAVLELVTTKAKPNFDMEMENVCTALQAVDLSTSISPRLRHQSISRNQRAALSEITDVLRTTCHAHSLPLALTWIPCNFTEEEDEMTEINVKEDNKSTKGKCILCVETSSCYVNDKEMEGFVHACHEHYLEEGQGIAGKALQSNHPFFFADVKMQDISDYPIVHHARKFGLNAAVAIRLRSTHTGDDDYILEFFLPINMTGGSEQQLLLDNLAGTMQRICKSLRTVSNSELVHIEGTKVNRETVPTLPDKGSPSSTSHTVLSNGNLNSIDMATFNISNSNKDGEEVDGSHKLVRSGSKRCSIGKKKNTTEKTVNLSVLRQYFAGSLKDASKALGMCPTTLKRICRSQGISRWPCRKLKKVTRSMEKLQTTLESVPGVEGTFNFDLVTSGFMAAGLVKQELESHKSFQYTPVKKCEMTQDGASMLPSQCIDVERSTIKVEDDEVYMEKNLKGIMKGKSIPNSIVEELDKSSIYMVECTEASKMVAINRDHSANSENGSLPSYVPVGVQKTVNQNSMKFKNSESLYEPGHSTSLAAVMNHNQSNTSSTTDSTNSSGSLVHSSAVSSPSFSASIHAKVPPDCVYTDSRLSVKATYNESIIRFKFDPSAGCFQLYEEVAKRLKLQNGMFQLNYLDDEEEWVMLVTEADLQECVEILKSIGTRNVKFTVRDIPIGVGSSDSSNCILSRNC